MLFCIDTLLSQHADASDDNSMISNTRRRIRVVAAFIFGVMVTLFLMPAGTSVKTSVWMGVRVPHGISFPSSAPPPAAPTVELESVIAGVSGRLWAAKPVRKFDKPLLFSGEVDTAAAPLSTPEALDQWFASPPRPQPAKASSSSSSPGCVSDKWVVITSIFAPSELILELNELEGWCTVVVADKKTPEAPWAALSSRVKLLTVEEQGQLSFRILAHLPWNHFGR